MSLPTKHRTHQTLHAPGATLHHCIQRICHAERSTSRPSTTAVPYQPPTEPMLSATHKNYVSKEDPGSSPSVLATHWQRQARCAHTAAASVRCCVRLLAPKFGPVAQPAPAAAGPASAHNSITKFAATCNSAWTGEPLCGSRL